MTAENVSNLAKYINLQIQEAEWTPNRKTQRNQHQGTSQSNFWKLEQNNVLKPVREKWHLNNFVFQSMTISSSFIKILP